MYYFADSAPAEIQQAAKGAVGPAIIAMRHNEALGEVNTDDVKADLQQLQSWRSAHC